MRGWIMVPHVCTNVWLWKTLMCTWEKSMWSGDPPFILPKLNNLMGCPPRIAVHPQGCWTHHQGLGCEGHACPASTKNLAMPPHGANMIPHQCGSRNGLKHEKSTIFSWCASMFWNLIDWPFTPTHGNMVVHSNLTKQRWGNCSLSF